MATASIAATTTAATATRPPYGVSYSSRSLSQPEVIIVHEKRTVFEAVIPPGTSVRELMKADSVKVRREGVLAFFF